MLAVDVGEQGPDRDAEEPDDPEDQPEGEPRRQFAAHHFPPVPQPEFTQGQPPG